MPENPATSAGDAQPSVKKTESLVLGGGCFWCVEAAYQLLDGVTHVESGYAGGHTKDPTYKQVCTGDTGHAEVVRIDYDPDVVSLRQLLDYFWEVHDPTTLNRQGADVGEQYRSIILYQDDAQKEAAEASLKEAQAHFKSPIVTQIVPLHAFYKAEVSHQDYFANHPESSYCHYVIAPKIAKLKKHLQEEKSAAK